jgi:hypothetical protein
LEEMNALKLHVDVDEAVATAVPALRPLMGRRVELIVLETSTGATKKQQFKDFVPLELPEGAQPLSLDDVDRLIAEGASKRAGV